MARSIQGLQNLHSLVAPPETRPSSQHFAPLPQRVRSNPAGDQAVPLGLLAGKRARRSISAALGGGADCRLPPPLAATAVDPHCASCVQQPASMQPVELSDEALYSVLLHALKHPSSAVAGLLLGTAGGEAVHVTAALPVCHGFVTLAPLLEAAMAQVTRF